MTESAKWTVKALLDWTTDFFTKAKTESPRLAAEVLLADCLEIPRIELYVRFDQEVESGVRSTFKDRVKRHANGEPVAYLVGFREFYSMKFTVNPNVLIPRPETEDLVAATLDRFADRKTESLKLADVGTGSGIIAVCLAKFLKNSEVLAIDRSADAIEVAKGNAEANKVAQRVRFLESDLLSEVDLEPKFDAIVSNPPYVSKTELEDVSDSVKKYEPMMALDGLGQDGGDLTRTLITQAAERLKPDGWLLLESSPMLLGGLKEFAEKSNQWKSPAVLKDQAGLDRMLVLQKS